MIILCIFCIITAREAFPEIDHEIIDELYAQSNRNMAVLYEMLIAMANPEAEANPDVIRAAQAAQQAAE